MNIEIINRELIRCCVCLQRPDTVYLKCYSPDLETTQYVCATCADEIHNAVNGIAMKHGKPLNETSKLKIFHDVFDRLAGPDKFDVSEYDFIEELRKTDRFYEDEIKQMIKMAMQNGQIYERRKGYYAKA